MGDWCFFFIRPRADYYCLEDLMVVETHRNPRHANWPEYCDFLALPGARCQGGPAHHVQANDAFEKACPLVRSKVTRHRPRWTRQLEHKIRKVSRLFEKASRLEREENWHAYWVSQHGYRAEVMKKLSLSDFVIQTKLTWCECLEIKSERQWGGGRWMSGLAEVQWWTW